MFSPVLEPVPVSVLQDEVWLARALQRGHGGPVGRAWLERAWLSFPGFWIAAPGGMCHWVRMCSQAGGGGTGCIWQRPSERAPGSLSERILASAWGLGTVPKAVLSWHTPGSPAACGVGASRTSGRRSVTGASGLEEGLREDTGDSGATWVRGGGWMWQ